jgi:hypothetical protein
VIADHHVHILIAARPAGAILASYAFLFPPDASLYQTDTAALRWRGDCRRRFKMLAPMFRLKGP